MKSECAVLVNSCDQYSEAWNPFFTLLRKYWPHCPYPMYLNTETETYNQHFVNVINCDGNSWGSRLHFALSQIDSEYVIVLLEDFFIQKAVDSEEIFKCIERMKNDDQIAVFYFSRITGYHTDSTEYEKYFHMNPQEHPSRFGRYMINCQAALWRKSVLMEAVRKSKTPWELEEDAYNNLSEDIKNMKYYCLKNAWYDKIREDDVFSYVLVRDEGYGIWRSKWLWNNKKLLKKEGIKVEIKKLSKMSKFDYKFDVLKQKIKQKIKKIFGK